MIEFSESITLQLTKLMKQKKNEIYILIPSSLLPKPGCKYFPGQWPSRDLTPFKLHGSIFLLN